MTVGAGISAQFIAHFRKLCQEHPRARSNLACDGKRARWRDAPVLGTLAKLFGRLAGSICRRTGPQCEAPQQQCEALHRQCVPLYHEGEALHRQCEALHGHLSPLHQQCEALHPLYCHYIAFPALNGHSVPHFREMVCLKTGQGRARRLTRRNPVPGSPRSFARTCAPARGCRSLRAYVRCHRHPVVRRRREDHSLAEVSLTSPARRNDWTN